MKQSLQLRLGQQLTMTPQLQQAIRLLQLSTLDLRQEIQEALESNLMLETEEEGVLADEAGRKPAANGKEERHDSERELNGQNGEMPQELPVDSSWEDSFDGYGAAPAGARHEEGEIDFLAFRSSALTLQDHLSWQLNLTPFGETDRAIATALIDAIDEDGYLRASLEEIADSMGPPPPDAAEVEAVLHRVQNFDPAGVGARDARECLLLQLAQLPADTPFLDSAQRLCRDYFELLASRDKPQILRRLKLDDAQFQEVTKLIRSLHPHPGSRVADAQPQYLVPDVFVSKRNGVWRVDLNPEATPRLRVNHRYAALIRRADNSQDNTYLKNHLQEARWFIKSLTSRNDTLLRVARKIVELQRGFFDHGPEAMRPLVLRDVAEALELHESTISRVTTQKYMYTPRGTLEFKYFFSSHVGTTGGGECSATAIQALIKKLIAAERADKPLSDNKLASVLSEQGIKVARRTVAKYREAMGIPPSNERKRLV